MNSGSKISANLGRRTRTGGNAHGWLWEITSRSTLAHVTIEKAWVAYFNTERPHQTLGMRPIEGSGSALLTVLVGRSVTR
jgi:hypothetical protein